MGTAKGFRPGEFARVSLHFEVFVAFGAAETEGAGVVADEEDAFGGVAGGGAEVAGFDAGGNEISVAGQGRMLERRDCLPHGGLFERWKFEDN